MKNINKKFLLSIILIVFVVSLLSLTTIAEIFYSYDDIVYANSRYMENNKNGIKNLPYNTYTSVDSRMLGLLSAPHSTKHWRDDAVKVADNYTGSIVDIIAKDIGCSSITKSCQDYTDPNYDTISIYRDQIVDLVQKNHLKFIIDIHGANSSRPFDIAIGTDHDKSIDNNIEIKDAIFDTAAKYDLLLDYNTTFPASGSNTVSKNIHTRTGIPAIQLEINGKFRLTSELDTETEVNNYNEMLNFIKDLITVFDQIISE